MKKPFPTRARVFMAKCAAKHNSLAPDCKKSWSHRLFQLCWRGCSLPQRDYSEQLGWELLQLPSVPQSLWHSALNLRMEGSWCVTSLLLVYQLFIEGEKSEGSSQVRTKNSPETGVANRNGYVEEESNLGCALNLTFSWERWGGILL